MCESPSKREALDVGPTRPVLNPVLYTILKLVQAMQPKRLNLF